MKKFVLLILSCLSFYNLYAQTYTISERSIEIDLATNDSTNVALVNRLLCDSLLNEEIDYIGLKGEFTKLPSNLSKLYWVKAMEMYSLKDIVIDKTFSKFENLKELMVFSKIERIDEGAIFPNIESIWFIGAIWTEFPIAICNWNTLKEIKIYNGYFSSLPQSIGKLTNLIVLNIGNNHVRILPDELYELENLESLSIYNNEIRNISDRICSMRKLKHVTLEGNKKLKLNKSIKDCLKGKITPLLVNPNSPYI